MCTRSQPTNRPVGRRGSACEGAQGRYPSRETVTVLRLARHPARRQGVRCMHCRTHTHPSNLWDCLPSPPVHRTIRAVTVCVLRAADAHASSHMQVRGGP